ncbi:hypothetical protein D3C71_1834770 [compost metagenome]
MLLDIEIDTARSRMDTRLFRDNSRIAFGLLSGTGDAGVSKADLAGDIELVGLGFGRIHLAFDHQVSDIGHD